MRNIKQTRAELAEIIGTDAKINIKIHNIYAPHPNWIAEHPLIKGHKYIPIGIIEDLLDIFYEDWDLKVKSERHAMDILVSVKLSLKKDYNVLRKLSGSAGLTITVAQPIESAYQLAKSLAIKDAADHLGALFGRDLNREVEEVATPQTATQIAYEKNRATILDRITKSTGVPELENLKPHAQKFNLSSEYEKKLQSLWQE